MATIPYETLERNLKGLEDNHKRLCSVVRTTGEKSSDFLYNKLMPELDDMILREENHERRLRIRDLYRQIEKHARELEDLSKRCR